MAETIGSRSAHLQELGLPAGATLDEIQAAYRRLARQNHPDMHPGEEGPYHSKMLNINAAREALLAGTESPGGDVDAVWRAMSAELDRQDWILRKMCGDILCEKINRRLAGWRPGRR